MNRFSFTVLVPCAVIACITIHPAHAQFNGPQTVQPQLPPPSTNVRPNVTVPPGYVLVPDAPLGAAPPAKAEEHSGGFISVSPAFAQWLQPYIDTIVNALILAAVGYLGNLLRNKFNINIDEAHRAALVKALQNQAGSLIADGMVRVQNKQVQVPDAALAKSANEIMAVLPDATKRLGLTPEYLQNRIKDTIPQISESIAAAAAGVAATPPPAPAAPAAPAPAAAKPA